MREAFLKLTKISAQKKTRNVDGISISHVGDLLISRTDYFILFLSEELGKTFGVEALEANESNYLRMGGY